jgi:divalent metal cation (Fe/Co/Zn/Cd) transporter
MPRPTPDPLPVEKRLRWAMALEPMSVGWNLLVGVVAVIVAVFASSLALLSLGADAIAATVGAAVVAWRFYAERRKRSEREQRFDWVTRVSGALLIVFCTFIAVAAISKLLGAGARPLANTVGITISGASFAVAFLLSRAKFACATAIASAALREDGWRNVASMWVSGITLLGLSANAVLDWWWVDPVAAFLLIPFLGMSGLQDLFGPLSPDITAHRLNGEQ